MKKLKLITTLTALGSIAAATPVVVTGCSSNDKQDFKKITYTYNGQEIEIYPNAKNIPVIRGATPTFKAADFNVYDDSDTLYKINKISATSSDEKYVKITKVSDTEFKAEALLATTNTVTVKVKIETEQGKQGTGSINVSVVEAPAIQASKGTLKNCEWTPVLQNDNVPLLGELTFTENAAKEGASGVMLQTTNLGEGLTPTYKFSINGKEITKEMGLSYESATGITVASALAASVKQEVVVTVESIVNEATVATATINVKPYEPATAKITFTDTDNYWNSGENELTYNKGVFDGKSSTLTIATNFSKVLTNITAADIQVSWNFTGQTTFTPITGVSEAPASIEVAKDFKSFNLTLSNECLATIDKFYAKEPSYNLQFKFEGLNSFAEEIEETTYTIKISDHAAWSIEPFEGEPKPYTQSTWNGTTFTYVQFFGAKGIKITDTMPNINYQINDGEEGSHSSGIADSTAEGGNKLQFGSYSSEFEAFPIMYPASGDVGDNDTYTITLTWVYAEGKTATATTIFAISKK